MRILHIDASKEWRGGQNQALLTAAGMAASGHAVTLLCRRDGALAVRAQAANLSMTTTSFHGELSPAAIFRVCGLLRTLRPDVLQAHDPPALAAAGVCGAPVRLRPRGRHTTRRLPSAHRAVPLEVRAERARHRRESSDRIGA